MKITRTIALCPDGSPLSLSDLPHPDIERWVWRRKAVLVAAVDGGLLSLESACERYRLTIDEFMSWKSDCSAGGFEALKIKSIQTHRPRRAAVMSESHGEARREKLS